MNRSESDLCWCVCVCQYQCPKAKFQDLCWVKGPKDCFTPFCCVLYNKEQRARADDWRSERDTSKADLCYSHHPNSRNQTHTFAWEQLVMEIKSLGTHGSVPVLSSSGRFQLNNDRCLLDIDCMNAEKIIIVIIIKAFKKKHHLLTC